MAIQHVLLHGGPMHGKQVAVQEGATYFKIRQPTTPLDKIDWSTVESADTIEHRIGTYSRVRYYGETDFEWDGWSPS